MNQPFIAHKLIQCCFLFILAYAIGSCAPSRIVRPMDKGQKSLSAHVGGPMIDDSKNIIPVPLSSIMYAQGVSDKITGFASIHATSLYYGVVQTDMGFCTHLYYNEEIKLGFSATPVLNMAFDTWVGYFKLWPQLDLNVYWELEPDKSFIYLGIENWFELSKYKAHEQLQKNHWLVNAHLGFTYVRNKWDYTLETKYLVPYLESRPNVVDYKGINGNGALGLYISFTRKF